MISNINIYAILFPEPPVIHPPTSGGWRDKVGMHRVPKLKSDVTPSKKYIVSKTKFQVINES